MDINEMIERAEVVVAVIDGRLYLVKDRQERVVDRQTPMTWTWASARLQQALEWLR